MGAAVEGDAEGTADGSFVGANVGSPGPGVGAGVGRAEGRAEGTTVGDFEGAKVEVKNDGNDMIETVTKSKLLETKCTHRGFHK